MDYWIITNKWNTVKFVHFILHIADECFQGFFSAKDLDKNAAPHFQKADKFYDALARQLVSQGRALDVSTYALDQICMIHCLGIYACSVFIPSLVFYLSCKQSKKGHDTIHQELVIAGLVSRK